MPSKIEFRFSDDEALPTKQSQLIDTNIYTNVVSNIAGDKIVM